MGIQTASPDLMLDETTKWVYKLQSLKLVTGGEGHVDEYQKTCVRRVYLG